MSILSTVLGVSEAERDQFLRDFDADPYPFLAAMREMGKVVLDPVMGIYHVTDGEEIEAVLRDWQTFSASPNFDLLGPLFGRHMVMIDGAEHARMRNLFAAAFTPSAVAGYAKTLIEPVLEEVLDSLRGRSRLEFVRDFCGRFPLGVIARWFAVPAEDHGRFNAWYEAMVESLRDFPLVNEAKRARAVRASRELGEYLRPIVRERSAAPRPGDTIGVLASAVWDGERLTEDEIVGFVKGLLFAGAETTTRLLATCMYGILSTGARDAVRADAALLESAIEEALRWSPPGQSLLRRATRDTEVAGVAIPEGALVSLEIAAYQHDPAHFPEPETFKADRRPKHFAFGAGRHVCMGAHLARSEAKIGIARFLDLFPRARLDPEREVVFKGIGMRSPEAVRLLVD